MSLSAQFTSVCSLSEQKLAVRFSRWNISRAKRLKRDGPIGLNEAISIAPDICEGLRLIHQQGSRVKASLSLAADSIRQPNAEGSY